jgi:hypothetical protein
MCYGKLPIDIDYLWWFTVFKNGDFPVRKLFNKQKAFGQPQSCFCLSRSNLNRQRRLQGRIFIYHSYTKAHVATRRSTRNPGGPVFVWVQNRQQRGRTYTFFSKKKWRKTWIKKIWILILIHFSVHIWIKKNWRFQLHQKRDCT